MASETKQEKSNHKKTWGVLGSIGAFLVAFGGKLKFLLPALKLLKFGKAGATVWSMALMVGAYAFIYPWTFALGIVIMIFIHEMGHVFAAKRKGLPVTAPAFIPFLGALIMMKKQPQNAEVEAYVAIGGPVLGGLGALLTLFLAVQTGYEPLYAIAMVGFFLNLLNLLPIHPLDGGRIVTAISRWLWLVGLLGGLVVILYLKAFIFLFFWILFAWELFSTYILKKKEKEKESFEQITVPKHLFEDNYLPIPGENHSRRLDYTLSCRIEDRATVVALYYPGIGHIGNFIFPYGDVTGVELKGAKTSYDRDDVDLQISIKFLPGSEQRMVKEESYYQVPGRVRFAFGVTYFGLVIFLGYFMYLTQKLTGL